MSLIGTGLAWGPVTDQANAYTADIANGATLLTIPVAHTLDGVCHALGEFSRLQARLDNRRTQAVIRETNEIIAMTAHDQVLVQGSLDSGIPISVHYRGGVSRGTGLLLEVEGSKGHIQISASGGQAQLLDLEIKGATGDERALAKLNVPEKYKPVGVAGGAFLGNVARFYDQLARTSDRGRASARLSRTPYVAIRWWPPSKQRTGREVRKPRIPSRPAPAAQRRPDISAP